MTLTSPATASDDRHLSAASPDTRDPSRALVVQNVSYRYPGTDAAVLDGVDLLVPQGGTVIVRGENGIGKSTLLDLIAGGRVPTSGDITRPHAEIRFLSPGWSLFDELTVEENLAYLNRLRPGLPVADEDRVRHYGMASLSGHRLSELSVGQRQRFGLLCCLNGPGLIVLDEPLVGVDDQWRTVILDDLRRLLDGGASTAVIATHRPQADFDRLGPSDEMILT